MRTAFGNSKPAVKTAGFLSCSLSILLAWPPYADAAQKPTASLEFNLSNKQGTPDGKVENKFDCLDKIYSVTQARFLALGKHSVEFRWVNPHGEAQEITKYDFFVNTSNANGVDLWAWLKLSRGQGAGLFQWLDPATGLEEFIGEWTVELLIDGEKLAQNNFIVNC